MSDNCSVKVAVRVRPLAIYEIHKGCKDVVQIIPENDQILIHDKSFTFNYVFGTQSTQEEVYNRSVKSIIGNLFKGYNVTILAYGQTGSGKTHSMGTAYRGEGDMGVIPRAIKDIFDYIKDNFSLDFNLSVSFVELYQEVLYDLLSGKPRDQCVLDIREDVSKGNHIPGLTEVPVSNSEEVFDQLAKGSTGRATGSTNMNSQSSRSHAIFTVNIALQHKTDEDKNITAKLHLVDLAGSERPKKTGAVGNTFKEGVNINKGLFVLGNVISCLGDETKSSSFVPYRDSNLTRLLKDSLGGNSITLMIACVSPADYNLDETVSTLRYADRAKKIKNKPVVNQDPHVAEVNKLKNTIQQLRLQIVGQGGPMVCPAEIELLKKKIADLEKKNRELNVKLSASLVDNTALMEKFHILQHHTENLSKRLMELGEDFEATVGNISTGLEANDADSVKLNVKNLLELQQKFETINSEQKETENEIKNHEETFIKFLHTGESGNETPVEFDEQQNEYTDKQLALNNELKDCMKQLALKQGLANQLVKNLQCMTDYNGINENEEKIAALQKERDELLQQLKAVHTQDNVGKISEQRRKRLKELESQIHDLNKKVAEQSRLIKLKEKDEKRIKQLDNEIMLMKQNKVKLMKKIREESEKFRTWKIQREKELAKLKQQDRKKDNEIAKIKSMNAKQQNVLKRKVEEAHALNKRLQQSLQLRKQAQEMKNTDRSKQAKTSFKQEFEVYFNLIEAAETVNNLLEDRAKLQGQLEILKANEATKNSEECRSLEEDIECRSAQIQDFQNKLLESDEDNKKSRFENIQTMAEAKQALQVLFEQATEIKRKAVQNELKLTEAQEITAEFKDYKKNYEMNMKMIEEKYDNQLSELQNVNEEKVSFLLRQLCGGKATDECVDEELKKHCQILEEHNTKLQETIAQLNMKLDLIKTTGENGATTPVVPKKPKKISNNDTFIMNDDEKVLDSSIEELFDDPNDPDWRNTPLGKRILKEKKKLSYFKSINAEYTTESEERPSFKRSSEGGCTCKTKCSARCGCRKLNRGCRDSCKCDPSSCLNRDSQNIDVSNNSDTTDTQQSGEVDETESFKKPKIDVDRKKRQKKRHLFQD
ncbi:chromosome-associated kinesin KIF4 [Aethina tumida]|uniref:chromosome-associated kinesin KIF4 n=1 Tax=Aethina tumida TaxID=116153 RepID=UPI00096AE252|nr:chromosome-associated kinesin KIF4 [Aethina tumida]